MPSPQWHSRHLGVYYNFLTFCVIFLQFRRFAVWTQTYQNVFCHFFERIFKSFLFLILKVLSDDSFFVRAEFRVIAVWVERHTKCRLELRALMLLVLHLVLSQTRSESNWMCVAIAKITPWQLCLQFLNQTINQGFFSTRFNQVFRILCKWCFIYSIR